MHGCMSHNKRYEVRDIIHQLVRNRFCFDFLQKKVQEFRVQWKHGFFYLVDGSATFDTEFNLRAGIRSALFLLCTKEFYMAGASISRLNEERPRKTREKKTIRIQIKYRNITGCANTRFLLCCFLMMVHVGPYITWMDRLLTEWSLGWVTWGGFWKVGYGVQWNCYLIIL